MHVHLRDCLAVALALLVGSALALIDWHPTMNSGEWAAWVQAIGSILAIIASAGIAIWVPIYMRDIEARGEARRARRDGLHLLEVAIGAVASLWQVTDEKQFYANTPHMIRERINTARTASSRIPPSMLMRESTICIARANLDLQVLEIAVGAFERAEDPYLAANNFDFQGLIEGLISAKETFEGCRPICIDGDWLLYTDDDRGELPQGAQIRF